MDDSRGITSGTQFLSPSGRIWTVRSITPNGARVVLASDETDGEHGVVMDIVAVLRMVRIDPERGRIAAVEHVEAAPPDNMWAA